MPVSRLSLLPGDLVLQDIPERNVVDDLRGKPLDGVRVTAAKHEELTEMYRRQVWVEIHCGLPSGHRQTTYPCEVGGDEQGR